MSSGRYVRRVQATSRLPRQVARTYPLPPTQGMDLTSAIKALLIYNVKVQDIFRIERSGELDRFSNSPYAKFKNSDRRLLWHGSRCTNYGGILSQGLRIAPPEAPVSGYAFGKGIYMADISTKSANYCWAHSSGNIGLLLLCEAELGKPMLEMSGGDPRAAEMAKAEGRIATWGKGGTAPKGWKDAACVHQSLKGVSMVCRL